MEMILGIGILAMKKYKVGVIMILYLCSAITDERFSEYLKTGKIKNGHQAQKFNSLIIKGLANYSDVSVVANPPYCSGQEECKTCEDKIENIRYICLGNNQIKLHKLMNFREMYHYAKQFCTKERPEAIICDAINPLASLNALIMSRRYGISTVAIVTDIPEYMDAGRENIFTKITSVLLKKYDAYVLLTEAMNNLVNKKGRPYIIMEGSCDISELEKDDLKEKINSRFVCVYTGSLSGGTGIETLVDAFCKIDKNIAELHIYGSGVLVNRIKQVGNKSSNIIYKGNVSNREAVKAQKSADLLINPRPVDILYGNVSFPSKIMEYMASGTPVLTTRLPGIPKEYFNYVYTIEDDTSDGIVEAIYKIMNVVGESRKQLGMQARQYVLENKNNIIQASRIYELARKARCH